MFKGRRCVFDILGQRYPRLNPEQLMGREGLGPWSDIYSVGASLHACITGSPPQRADERGKRDELVPAVKQFAGRYNRQLLQTIDWCLYLDPLKRPQSVYALQKALASPTGEDAVQASWFTDWSSRLRTFIGRE